MKKKVLTILSSVLVANILNAQDIPVIPDWQLLGATEDINTSTFDGKCVDFIWHYNKGWKVHMANGRRHNLPIKNLDFIKKGEGFWIRGNGHCEVNATTHSHLNKGNNHKFNISDYNKTTNLTQEVKDSLAYMGNEEKLAYDVYMNLYKYHKENNDIEIKQLYNIATNSENKHISLVQSLIKRYELNMSDFTNIDETTINENNISISNIPTGVYNIADIQNLYNDLYDKGIQSQKDALEVGCMIEVTDINDLNKYILQAKEANATDIKATFELLRDESYKHYMVFDKSLKNLEVSEGCCSLGTIDGVNYCHPEYLKNINQNSNHKEKENEDINKNKGDNSHNQSDKKDKDNNEKQSEFKKGQQNQKNENNHKQEQDKNRQNIHKQKKDGQYKKENR